MIPNEKLKQLYAAMVKLRLLERRAQTKPARAKSSRTGSHGRESAVGAAIDLRREDWLIVSQSLIAFGMLKGAPLPAVLSQLRAGGNAAAGKGDSAPPLAQLLPQRIVPASGTPAAQLHIAAGIALATPAKSGGNVVLALCDRVSPADRLWREGLDFARLRCLPLVIVVPVEYPQKASTASAKAVPPRRVGIALECGLPVIPVDAHDVVAMYRVAHESIHKARHGGGPTLIEATTFRIAGRLAAEPRDAIVRMDEYLSAKGLFSEAWKQGVIDKSNRAVDLAAEA